jgi:hypothetical protein
MYLYLELESCTKYIDDSTEVPLYSGQIQAVLEYKGDDIEECKVGKVLYYYSK